MGSTKDHVNYLAVGDLSVITKPRNFAILILFLCPRQFHILIFPISNKLQILLHNLKINLIKGILTPQSPHIVLLLGERTRTMKLIKFVQMENLIYIQTWSSS